MELWLQVIPAGDTTSREISEASQNLREALEGLQGIVRVEGVREPIPDEGKGVGEAIGKFLISLAPAALRAMMQALKG